jgi:hypothetical protein
VPDPFELATIPTSPSVVNTKLMSPAGIGKTLAFVDDGIVPHEIRSKHKISPRKNRMIRIAEVASLGGAKSSCAFEPNIIQNGCQAICESSETFYDICSTIGDWITKGKWNYGMIAFKSVCFQA